MPVFYGSYRRIYSVKVSKDVLVDFDGCALTFERKKMQVDVITPFSPRAAYYKRLPLNSPTRLAINKYLQSQEGLSSMECLEIYRYLRDFAGARLRNCSLQTLDRGIIDSIVHACLDVGADPF